MAEASYFLLVKSVTFLVTLTPSGCGRPATLGTFLLSLLTLLYFSSAFLASKSVPIRLENRKQNSFSAARGRRSQC